MRCRGPRPRTNAVFLLLLASFPFPTLAVTSETWCLERGFDRSNLACDTCALLEESTTLRSLQQRKNAAGDGDPVDVVAECQACCQAHKRNPILHPGESLRGKYRSALLTYSEHGLDQELKDFLERDLDDVLSLKGERRFQVVQSEQSGGPEDDMLRMMGLIGGGGFGASPPKLLLFEEQKQGGWSAEDEEDAGEVITLRGWKREDLRDMLLTLLPNA